MLLIILVLICLYCMTENANGLIKLIVGVSAFIAAYIALGIFVFDNDWNLFIGSTIAFVVVAVFASALFEPIKKSIGFIFTALRTK